jgi:glycosyltransferase involved in cell wall biosynthesis
MPRLLSLNNYHYRRGGADAMHLEHQRILARLGWETASFSMQHPDNEASPWEEHFADELEFGHDYPVHRKLVMASRVIYSFEARRKLGRLLDKWRPDIAHAHNIYHHLSPSVLDALRVRGIPAVLTAHDLKLACPAYKMLNNTGVCERCRGGNLTHVVRHRCVHDSLAISALVFVESAVHRLLGLYRRNLACVTTPSRFFRSKLAQWGWPEDRLRYIPNFVRSQQFVPEFEPGGYVLYFGRLAPEKGIGTLIEAAGESGVALRIAGSGPSEDTLRARASDFDNIRFEGYVAGEALHALIRRARVVVLPSEWYENAPVSVLEAYALGKPVIGARIGGIPELIEEDATGFLFASGDRHALAALLVEIDGLPASRLAEMGRHARARVIRDFSEQRYVEGMYQLYQDLGVALPPTGN